MSTPPLAPAFLLEGKTLADGWKVLKRIERSPDSTGGTFSVGYVVEDDSGRKAYLKALDYSAAFDSPDPARILSAMTSAYNFERDVLARCKGGRLSRIVTPLGDGQTHVDNVPFIPKVSYLIFEIADGDARAQLDRNIDLSWKLRSLHHVATGIRQLHETGIAHQDLKPSNVLVFGATESKICDLGRAAVSGRDSPHDDYHVAGDKSYAPPELLYRSVATDWRRRRLGCDVYLLGSLAMFFFTQASMTPAILSRLPPTLHWKPFTGTFEDVLPFVRNAFDKIIELVDTVIKKEAGALAPELTSIIRQLCDPNPNLRGHPQERNSHTTQYSLERYVSRLDLLAKRAASGRF